MKKIGSKKILELAAILLVFAGGGVYWWYQDSRIQSAADCTSVEKFDPSNNTCYYECSTDEECDKLAKQVDAEIDAFFSQSKARVGNEADGETQKPGQITYQNNAGNLEPTPRSDDAPLWDLFGRIAGNDITKNTVASFITYTDDQDSTAAAVWRADNPAQWHVTVNKAYKDNVKDLVHTLVHESAHILTLNTQQVPEAVEGSCPNLSLSEGCANSSAYINSFYQKFWKQYGSSVPKNDGENQDEVTKFYDDNGSGDVFVSEYAATNVTEDAAESFAIFVLAAKPTGTSTRDQKVRGFYDYPELVEKRNQIRAKIANELSARKLLR